MSQFGDVFGEAVREEWVRCKQSEFEQGLLVPDHHLTSFDELDPRNQQIDRRIGLMVAIETVAMLGKRAVAEKNSAAAALLIDWHTPLFREYQWLIEHGAGNYQE